MVVIASWNMNERPPGNPAAWTYARRAWGADVLLAQEAVVPTGERAAFRPSGTAGRDGKERRWGSAVVAFDAYFGLKESLEALLGHPVDLVSLVALENPYLAASVEESGHEVYAA